MHEDADDPLEGKGDVDTADPLRGTDNINIQPNTISCSNQNITDSVPVTTISGEDNIQGKFIYYKCLHKNWFSCI